MSSACDVLLLLPICYDADASCDGARHSGPKCLITQDNLVAREGLEPPTPGL